MVFCEDANYKKYVYIILLKSSFFILFSPFFLPLPFLFPFRFCLSLPPFSFFLHFFFHKPNESSKYIPQKNIYTPGFFNCTYVKKIEKLEKSWFFTKKTLYYFKYYKILILERRTKLQETLSEQRREREWITDLCQQSDKF